MRLIERIADIRIRVARQEREKKFPDDPSPLPTGVTPTELQMFLDLAEAAVQHVGRCSQWECECSSGVFVNNWERQKEWG